MMMSRKIDKYTDILLAMTKRSFQERYRTTIGGPAWVVGAPFLTVVVYTVVFSAFLKIKFGDEGSSLEFAIYLICGLFPWTALSESVMGAIGVIKENTNLVKRVVIPLNILPLKIVLVNMTQLVIGLCLLCPLIAFESGGGHPTFFFFPLILLLQLLFTTGMCWLVAALSVYLPDTGQIINFVLPLWMFATPIFYPETMIPSQYRLLLEINPMYGLIRLYRETMIAGRVPDLREWLFVAMLCTVMFLSGLFFFNRLKRGFADIL